MYGTSKKTVHNFGGSTPNLGDSGHNQNSTGNPHPTGPRKAKSGILFGNSNYREGRNLILNVVFKNSFALSMAILS